MNSSNAALMMRIVSGVYFLIHGGLKLFVFTPAGTAGYFQSIGLPSFLAYVTIAVEIIGGLMLIVGFKVREVSLLMIPLLLGAAYFGHGSNGFLFSNTGGGWEYIIFWAFAMLAQAMLGAGAYSIGSINSDK